MSSAKTTIPTVECKVIGNIDWDGFINNQDEISFYYYVTKSKEYLYPFVIVQYPVRFFYRPPNFRVISIQCYVCISTNAFV